VVVWIRLEGFSQRLAGFAPIHVLVEAPPERDAALQAEYAHYLAGNFTWWERNFRMYANVQRWAQPSTRVLVIAGQGHTAIMKQFLESDSRRVEVPLESFLGE